MSYWAEIKKFINNKIGKDNFESIDETILNSHSSILPYEWDKYIDDEDNEDLIYKQIDSSNSQEDIKLISYLDGWIGLKFSITTEGTVYLYVNDNIVWEGMKGLQRKPIKVKTGDIIKFAISKPRTYAGIWIYCRYNLGSIGLREIE